MKKKWIGYAGERWMGFRTELTSDYITKTKHNLEPSYIMYSYIDKKVYEEFSKSRRSLELLAKIQKGKQNRSRNIYSHRLSRGRYDKLEQIMIKENRKQRQQELGDPSKILDLIPSPPSSHAKWKRALQIPGGEFTLQASHEVTENIVSRYFFQHCLFKLIQFSKDELLYVQQD